MNYDLFDNQKLTIQKFAVKPEIFSDEVKSQKYLVEEDPCDGFFETIQGKLKEIENSDNPHSEDIFSELPQCKLVFKSLNILGEYYPCDPPIKSFIKYYKQTPQTLEIVKIHERFHAIHHLMPDAKGQIWDDFPTTDPFYKELLAQLFTFIYIREYETSLLTDFENLNQNQPFIYRTFKIFNHYKQDHAEKLYWIIRDKKQHYLYQLLEDVFNKIRIGTINNAVFDGIRKTINRFREQPFLYFTESDIHASLSKDIMDGSSDILILGNNAVERKTIKTPVSLVHHEYPTNFRYEKKRLTNEGYSDEDLELTGINSKHGDRGNYDLVILSPNFIIDLFESHPLDGQLGEVLGHIINKDITNAQQRTKSEELIFAIEVKFIHMFNSGNIQMVNEVLSDNEKLKLAIEHKHCNRAINLVFCSSSEKLKKVGETVIARIRTEIDNFNKDNILNIFIESFIEPGSHKKTTTKPKFSKNQNGWSDLIKLITK